MEMCGSRHLSMIGGEEGALGGMIRRTGWLTDLATLGYDLWYACPDVYFGCEVVLRGWNDEATGRFRQGLQAGV